MTKLNALPQGLEGCIADPRQRLKEIASADSSRSFPPLLVVGEAECILQRCIQIGPDGVQEVRLWVTRILCFWRLLLGRVLRFT